LQTQVYNEKKWILGGEVLVYLPESG
jgi:hypothetical protein